jgi:hypothetical protein
MSIPDLPSGQYLKSERQKAGYSKAEWLAIREDMKRWQLAVTMYGKRNVREWLAALPAGEYREDMRRRLNAIRERRCKAAVAAVGVRGAA